LKAMGRWSVFDAEVTKRVSEAVERARQEEAEKAKKKPAEYYEYGKPVEKELSDEEIAEFDAEITALEAEVTKGTMPAAALEGLKRWREKHKKKELPLDEDAEKAKKKPKEYYYYGQPKKEDFESEIQFSEAQKAYDEFKAAMKKQLETELAGQETIRKGVNPKQGSQEAFDWDKAAELADTVIDGKELLRKVTNP